MANILPSPPLFGLTSGRLIVATGAASVGNSGFTASGNVIGLGASGQMTFGEANTTGINFAPVGVNRWQINATQLVPFNDNSSDIGSSSLRVRNGYFNGIYLIPGLNGLDVISAGSLNLGTSNANVVAIGNAASTQTLGQNSVAGAGLTQTWNPVYILGVDATNVAQLQSTPTFNFLTRYWAGGVGPSTNYVMSISGVMDSTAPTAHLSFQLGGSEKFRIGNNGNIGFAGGATLSALQQSASGTTSFTIQTWPTDGATSVGLSINTAVTVSTGGVQMVTFTNNGSLKSAINDIGTYNSGGAGFRPGATSYWDSAYATPKYTFTAAAFAPFNNNANTLGAAGAAWSNTYTTLITGIVLLKSNGQSATNTTAMTIQPDVADGATSIGLVVNNNTSLTTAGSKLVQFSNAGTAKHVFNPDGSSSNGYLAQSNSGASTDTISASTFANVWPSYTFNAPVTKTYDVHVDVCIGASSVTTVVQGSFQLVVNGVAVTGIGGAVGPIVSITNTTGYFNVSFRVPAAMNAGNNTIQLQWRVSGGTGTLSNAGNAYRIFTIEG